MTVSDKQAQGEDSNTSPEQQAAVIVERMSTLRQDGRLDEVLTLGEELRRRFDLAAQPAVGVELSRSLLLATACLAQQARYPEALALCEDAGCVWDEGDTENRREWFRAARAAMRAMKHVTPAMVTEAKRVVGDDAYIMAPYLAMIDAALADE